MTRTARWRAERALLAATVAVGVVVPALTVLDLGDPTRPLLALLFFLLVPGVPVAILLRLANPLAAVAAGIAVSIASLLLVANTQLVAGMWDPEASVVTLALAGLLLVVPAALRKPAPPPFDPPDVPPDPLPPSRLRAPSWLPRVTDLVPARIVPLTLLAFALELWWAGTRTTPVSAAGAAGVIGVVSWPYVAGLALLAAVIAHQLTRPRPDAVVMTAAVVSLMVMLFGFVNAADTAASFPTGWVHAGFIDHISGTGAVATGFDARFSWPAFFAAGAVVIHAAGLPDAVPLIAPAPVVFNLLAIPGLLVIGRALTADVRATWLGVVIYACFNWFSQDYLSPQATVLLLYIAVLAVLLESSVVQPLAGQDGRLLALLARMRTLPERPPGTTAGETLAREGVLLAIATAAVVTHQLTPATLVGVLFLFAVTGGTRYRRLWLLTLLVFLAWFSFGAADFWRGHLDDVFGDIGNLGSTLGSSVSDRLTGDPVHGRMQQLRLLWSAGSLGLAGIGLWLRRRSPRVLLFAALAYGPFGLLVAQSYGGEVALRCFVYAQPAVAPLAAVTVLWALRRIPLRPVVLTALITLGALVLTATRGANVSFERVSASQVAVAEDLLDTAPPVARVALLADAGPLGFRRLVDLDVLSTSPEYCPQGVARCIRRLRPDYLYVTTTQEMAGRILFGLPAGWSDEVVEDLVRQRLYRRTWWSDDAVVLRRINGPLRCPCPP